MKKNFISPLLGVCTLLIIASISCGFYLGPPPATPTPQPTNTPFPTQTPEPTSTPAPTPTPTPQPVILSYGELGIPQTYMADLDAGVVPTDAKDSAFGNVDLWFEAVSNEDRFLETYNGALWAVIGPSEVGYDECKAAAPTSQRVHINDLAIGTYICVQTNAGNISIVRILGVDYSGVGTVKISFTTWHQP